MISKWTLQIKDPGIHKDFQKYAMDNVMRKMPALIAFQFVFVLANGTALFSDRFLNTQRMIQSSALFLIMLLPYLLTRATGKPFF